MTVLPGDLLARLLTETPAAPLITFYDDATGERIELSAATLANWVAKAANLLQDEFDVGPGSRVVLALPVHWQTAVVLLATWSCGAAAVDAPAEDDDALAGVDVLLAAQDRLAAISDRPDTDEPGPQLLGLSLDAMGRGMTGYAGPARDFALEVRTQADAFFPYQPPDPAGPGLITGGLELPLARLVDTARELADRLTLRAGDRVLVTESTAEEAGPIAWLLAPLAVGASLVLCRHPRPEDLPRRAATERVTATFGADIDGVRALGRTTGRA